MTQNKHQLLVAALILTLSAPARGADHDQIIPYLADDVVATAYVDLTKIDLPASVRQMSELGVIPPGDLETATNAAEAAQPMIDRLRQLGLRRIYAVMRTADVAHGGPSWVLTVDPEGDAEAIIAALRPLIRAGQQGDVRLPSHFQAGRGVIVAANDEPQLKATIKNEAAGGAIRASVGEAIEYLGGHGVGILIFGDADSRRVVRDMFPRLPEPFGVIDGRLIADGLRWGGAAIDLPPGFQLSITIQADQPGTAGIVKDVLSDLIEKAKAAARQQTADSPNAVTDAFVEALELLRPEVDNTRITLSTGSDPEGIAALAKVIGEPILQARRAAERTQRMSKFKMIGLAMHNYAARKKSFPPAAITDGDGNRLLSWRVAILPYLDENELYEQFRLDEPWDSPHNRELVAKMPEAYADPNRAVRRAVGNDKTTFVVPTGPKTVFRGAEGPMVKDIIDGTSNTVLTVEVVPQRAVVWTQPEDWEVDLENPFDGVSRGDGRPLTTGFCDGSARIVDLEHPADRKNWPLYLQPDDRQTIER